MITRLAAWTAATVAVALTAVGVASAASLHVSEEPVLANIAVVFQDCDVAAPTDAGAIVVAGPGCADGEAPGTALGLPDGPGGPGAPIDVTAPSPTPSAPAPGQAPTPGPTPPTPADGSPTPGTPDSTATAEPAPPTTAEPTPSTTADPTPTEPDSTSSPQEGDGV